MKRRNREKNFISYCKLSILTGMLFFFMLSSSIPVHAEGLSDLEGSAYDPSAEADSNRSEDVQGKAVETEVIDIASGKESSTGDVQDALGENNHTIQSNSIDGADEKNGTDDDGDDEDEQREKDDASDGSDDEEYGDDEKELDDDSMKSEAEIIVEEAVKPDDIDGEEKQITELPMVDAPEIAPEPGDNNVFGVAGQYYVSVPKSMAFRKLANGDFETLQSSYYTVNSGLEPGYKLSVRVSGDQGDEAVQLSNETGTVHRKVEVSTMACDIWQYRPDGTVLTVNEADEDESGYGKELVLDGPGKFKAKCRLQKYADDVLNAGTWSGSILFTVTCTPEPEEKVDSTAEEVQTDMDMDADTGQQETKRSAPARRAVAQPVQQVEAEESLQIDDTAGESGDMGTDPQDTTGTEDDSVPAEFVGDETVVEKL